MSILHKLNHVCKKSRTLIHGMNPILLHCSHRRVYAPYGAVVNHSQLASSLNQSKTFRKEKLRGVSVLIMPYVSEVNFLERLLPGFLDQLRIIFVFAQLL